MFRIVIGVWPMSDAALAYDDRYVREVLFPLKSGKEATVFCCAAEPHTGLAFVAAKVYRPLDSRGFRNDAVYQRGRHIGDARLRRAYQNKSRAGQGVQFANWVSAEYETLRLLHSNGAAVPEPYARTETTVIMEYIGDAEDPAPTLSQVRLSRAESRKLYLRLIDEISLWLRCGRVHADLSAFNVLYWKGDVRVIDFPQAVDPAENDQAFKLLLRDLENLHHYFRESGVPESAREIAGRVWRENADCNALAAFGEGRRGGLTK